MQNKLNNYSKYINIPKFKNYIIETLINFKKII